MRDLANASVEGLLVCDGETIVSANTSFAALAGHPASYFAGVTLESCFPDRVARLNLLSARAIRWRQGLRQPDGSVTPVELILRPIAFNGRAHHVIAVRDLKAAKSRATHPLPRASRSADVAS